MGEARAEISIARPAADVWAVIGNFGDMEWMPGVEQCEVDGTDRILTLAGLRIVEREFGRDDEARVLTYGIVDGPVKPEVHEATITVNAEGDGSHVTWDVVTDDALTDAMKNAYDGALAALKDRLEG